MALGGGTFLVQNKVIPGSYINFVSVSKASSKLADRGYGSMPLELDWGVDGEVFEVSNSEFEKDSLKIFGYEYTHEKLKGLRDLFANLKTLYAYRLNSGEKASNSIAVAKYSGVRGNDIKTIVKGNIDDNTKYSVSVVFGDTVVCSQIVSNISELSDNDFVVWNRNGVLVETAGEPLMNGSNGTVTGLAHQNYINKIESYTFNVLGVDTTDETVKGLYVNFTKRMRDEIGVKMQTVLYNKPADYEGIINVKNKIVSDKFNDSALVYWVVGLEASCDVNKSCLNKVYNGEFDVVSNYTQNQLTNCINNGEFVLHKVSSKIRVLSDINSLVTVSDSKSDDFKQNQTIRVCDQIANDIASLFANKYLGEVPNDKAGRVSLWADIVKHHEQLQEIRAIQDFKDSDVIVEQGNNKNSVIVVDRVSVVNTMAILYMTVKVA